jgi:5-methylthioadenosine/S-adenosylhomocysteine deaminase
LAEKYNAKMHIHLSESLQELQDCQNKHGQTPVELLATYGVLDQNLIAAHCVHLTDHDMDLLVQNQVGISHNPESNMKLGNGVAPISALLKKGARVGLGTDGAASNNDLSLLGEVDFAAKMQKGHNKDATLLTSLEAVEMLTINGAKALHLDHKIGSIESGKQADIILIDIKSPHLTPMYNPYSHIVYCAQDSDVKTVIINGKVIVKNRLMLNQDIDEIKSIADGYCLKIKKYLE